MTRVLIPPVPAIEAPQHLAVEPLRQTLPETLGHTVLGTEARHDRAVMSREHAQLQIDWLEQHADIMMARSAEPQAATRMGRLRQKVGGKVVYTAQQQAFLEAHSLSDLETKANRYDAIISTHETQGREQLETAREFLNTIPEGNKAAVNTILNTALANTHFVDWAPETSREQPTDWLSILSGVPHDKFIEFLDWNVERTADAQKAFEQMLPGLKQRFKNRLNHAVAAGDLPEQAAVNLVQFEKVKFYAGDIFTTIARGAGGYYYPDRPHAIPRATNMPEIVLSTETLASLDDAEHIFTHEGVHSIAGEDEEKTNRGLETIVGQQRNDIWFDEAFVEHTANMLLGKTSMNRPYPAKRDPNTGVAVWFGYYIHERELMSVAAEHIPMSEIADIYFDNDPIALPELIKKVAGLAGGTKYWAAVHKYDRSPNAVERAKQMERLTVVIHKNIRGRSAPVRSE